MDIPIEHSFVKPEASRTSVQTTLTVEGYHLDWHGWGECQITEIFRLPYSIFFLDSEVVFSLNTVTIV